MSLKKKFNTQDLLFQLNAAAEAQIAVLQSPEKGALRTLFSAARHSLKVMSTGKKLAQAFGIPLNKGLNNNLFQQIAEKAKEQNLAGADRLQQIMNWNKEFWSSDEVKNSEKTRNVLKEARIVKELAQKRPKP